MAKPLIVNLAGVDLPLDLNKVERSDLYGFIEIETVDERGRKCTMATLADDGKTIIGSGGAAQASLSPEGDWLDKKTLTPTDAEGQKMTPVPSSYSAPVPLSATATIEEYLGHNIKSVYQISSAGDLAPLMAELKKGTIFTFPYSFRGGLDPDAGFLLLASDGTPFFAAGVKANLEFVGLEASATAVVEEDQGDEEEGLDFSMM